MANVVVSSNSIGTGTRLNPGPGAGAVILQGVSVVTTDDNYAAVMDDRQDLTVFGTISSGGDGVYVRAAIGVIADSLITVARSGQVHGDNSGIRLIEQYGSVLNHGHISGNSFGIRAVTDFASVVNAGSIGGLTSGVSLQGRTNFLVNTGTILGAKYNAVFASGQYFRLSNSGDISGAQGVFYFDEDGIGLQISNHGTISGTGSFGINVYGKSGGLIENFGAVEGGVSLGGDTSAPVLRNSGTIGAYSGTGSSVYGASTNDVVHNSGVLSAGTAGVAISLSGGDDRLFNSGTIMGDVDLGEDADLYAGVGGGLALGTVLGADGPDTLRGGSAEDTLDGGEGNDLLRGGGGDDVLLGDLGNDTLRGGSGDDAVSGGGWDDLVQGGKGDDTLDGGGSNDTVQGGAGDDLVLGDWGADRLFGGPGNDTVTGGAGNDVFVYRRGHELVEVTDFTDGMDRIDLRSWGFVNFLGVQHQHDVSETTDGVVFDFGNGDILTVNGVSIADLSFPDFLF